jgi:ATP-binding cassette subfamily G (WHITE) protein 2 (PDR)
MDRGFERLRGDMTIFLSGLVGNTIMALIIGSVFYNLPDNTNALYSRGALLFFAILMAAFASSLEILTLYAQRGIVEKHAKYAFYHPYAEAVSSMICDLPNKIGTCIVFSLTLYFMTNLRRTPGHFFVYFLYSFVCTLTMSMYFRSIASLSRTLSQAMAPAALFILALVIYTGMLNTPILYTVTNSTIYSGFAIPTRDMHPWFRWLNYLDPVAYGFEALMINEFHNRQIPCSQFVPAGPTYEDVSSAQRICSTTGAAAGANFVDGDTYLAVNFQYYASHQWRNLGILIALMAFGCTVYLTSTEFITAKKSKGEVLLFRRGLVPDLGPKPNDEESNAEDRPTVEAALSRTQTVPEAPTSIQKQTAIFHWDGVNYDIKIKGEPRRLLDDVDGWVKPGTLTALMVCIHYQIEISRTKWRSGCFRCWKNYSARCSCVSCHYGRGDGPNASRRTFKGHWISKVSFLKAFQSLHIHKTYMSLSALCIQNMHCLNFRSCN